MLRRAETKDLIEVSRMVKDLIIYCRKSGADVFSEDDGILTTGIIEHVVLMMNDPNAIIFVQEGDSGALKGMIAGALVRYPNYHKHTLVGEIRHLYPISFASVELFKAFETWRTERGATISTAYVLPSNTGCLKAYEKHGLRIVQYLMTGDIQEKRKHVN